MVAFGASSAAAMARHHLPIPPPSARAALVAISRMPGRVSVPVLSQQSTSTRARPSIAGEILDQDPRRASRTAPTANASRSAAPAPRAPSPPTPATEPRTASSRLVAAKELADDQQHARGIITQVTTAGSG